MKNFYVILFGRIGVLIAMSLYFITDNSWWIIPCILLFGLGLDIKSMLRNKSIKKNAKKATRIISPVEPIFKKIVREYQPDLNLVNTPEKAMLNFTRCLNLFKSLCRAHMSGIDKMNLEEVLEYRDKSVPSIEANYLNEEVSSWGIRARLHIPYMDDHHCSEYSFLRDHIPVLTTGDHLIETQDIFDYFVYQFLKEGIVVRFQI